MPKFLDWFHKECLNSWGRNIGTRVPNNHVQKHFAIHEQRRKCGYLMAMCHKLDHPLDTPLPYDSDFIIQLHKLDGEPLDRRFGGEHKIFIEYFNWCFDQKVELVRLNAGGYESAAERVQSLIDILDELYRDAFEYPNVSLERNRDTWFPKNVNLRVATDSEFLLFITVVELLWKLHAVFEHESWML